MTLAPERPAGGVPDGAPLAETELRELAASADPRITATNKMARYRIAVLVGDVLTLVGVSYLAGAVAGWPTRVSSSWASLDGATMRGLGTAIAVVWLVALFVFSGYSRKRIGAGTDEYAAVALATTATAGLTAMVAYVTWTDVPRGYVLVLFGGGLVGLGLWRFGSRRIVRAIRLRDAYVIPTVLLGTQPEVERVMSVLNREAWAGYAVQGVVITDSDDDPPDEVRGVPVVGTTTTVKQILEELETQTLIVASTGGVSSMGLRRLMWQLEDSDIEVVVAPAFTDVAGARIHVRPVAGLPLLQLRQPDFTGPQRVAKRVSGFLVALLLLVLLAPTMAAIAWLIRRDSEGPVLFRQTRVGRDGREFQCLKFRTMYVDAEARLHELHQLSDGNELLFKMHFDPRVTDVGRRLRRFSLDELPQLVNVLRGEMALVGPRPPLPKEVQQYSGDLHRRLLVAPGMTGLWQVSGRSDLSLHESTRLDLYYVDNWSLLYDLEIVLRTIRAVVTGRGAY
jgi:exopolysaccharide biosynthesis polyprenyl glycosylphosphotransferase